VTKMPDVRLEQRLPQVEIRVRVEDATEPVPPPTPDCDHIRRNSKWWIASGIFLVVLVCYVLTSPGRIDIIDGQARFDVTYNWLVTGRPSVRDMWITQYMGVPGPDGLHYSYYGAPGSVFAMPLVWVGLATSSPDIRPSQFLFSLTSSIFGAGLAPILFLFYRELGIPARRAFAWTLVNSLATLVWPASTSTFDNAQHAFFTLAAVYFGFLSARRKSLAWAALGGLMAGVLFLYQEYFLLIIPALALSTLQWKVAGDSEAPGPAAYQKQLIARVVLAAKGAARKVMELIREAWRTPGEARSSCLRYAAFLVAAGIGVALSLAYNDWRFGSWFENGKVRSITAHAYPLFGNPLAGLLTLLVSPGKSIFLYSPPLLLCLIGMRSFRQQQPAIALAVKLSSALLVLFLACICFVGGDWCWGPRYLTPLLPLWALAFPFVKLNRIRRQWAVALLGAGLLIQLMALTVENQRFFLENGFKDYFWAEDPWIYFKHSALFRRFGEVASLRNGVPPTARFFNSIPVTEWCTYTILGPPPGFDRSKSPIWIRNFKIYYLPRPWPLWMSYLPPANRPIPMGPWLWSLFTLMALGGGLSYFGLRGRGCYE